MIKAALHKFEAILYDEDIADDRSHSEDIKSGLLLVISTLVLVLTGLALMLRAA
jgi:hypothetical protein